LKELNLSPKIRCLAEATLPQRGQGEPLFRKAWHARAFTLIVSLVNNENISWISFQERLVASLKRHQNAEEALTDEDVDLQYFDCWLEAAEETLLAEGFVGISDIAVQIEAIRHSVAEIREGQFAANSGQS